MFDLPLTWNSATIQATDPQKVIYGYQCNLDKHYYYVYITDFKDVWLETLSRLEIIEKANAYGMEDLNDESLCYLLDTLKKGFDSEERNTILQFSFGSKETDPEKPIHVKFNRDIDWEFSLSKQDSKTAFDIVSYINFQQFENHNYFKHKIDELEKMIEVKDHYIVYLTENYKALNGDELMKKYRKNNKMDVEYIHKYNKAYWSEKVQKSYAATLGRRKYLKKSSNDKLWTHINNSLEDKEAWIFSKLFDLLFSEELSPEPRFIKEELPNRTSNPVKIEDDSDTSSSSKKRPVVRKIGIIGPRKRKRPISNHNDGADKNIVPTIKSEDDTNI